MTKRYRYGSELRTAHMRAIMLKLDGTPSRQIAAAERISVQDAFTPQARYRVFKSLQALARARQK